MKIFKHVLLTLCLTGFMANVALAENTDLNFTVTPIANNVYSIISPFYGRPTSENSGWNSNSHFIVTNNGVLLFDTGSSEPIGQEIISVIKSVTKQPVRWVVNSHSHADHWLGNAAFTDTAVEIISTNSSATKMKKDGPEDIRAFSRMTEGATGSNQPVYPNLLLSQSEKRNFGGIDVEFILSSDAHSSGDILMWLPEQRIIFGGDVLTSDWMPIMTPDGNVPHLIEFLKTVLTLKPSVILPGHGKPTTITSVIRDIDLLSTVWQLVKKGHEDEKEVGEILSQVSASLGSKYRQLYKDFDSNSRYLVTMMYKKQL